ncbi:MAG: GNAT family N-acetyltransferase [Planctomycetes bacterium]|nr:GNAT family N-acetyltransferase [Planctomycetota bacterium]
MTALIRPVVWEELEPVREMDAQVFSALFTKLSGQTVALTLRERAYFEHWKRTDQDGALVAVEDGEIVGFSFCHARGKRGFIGPLGVKTERQGAGIGKKLVAESLAYFAAKGCELVGLDTFPSNPAAVSLYMKAGFEITSSPIHLQAPLEDVRLGATPPGSKLQVHRVIESDLDEIAAVEERLSGFSRMPDLRFLYSSGLGTAWKLTRDGRHVGHACGLLKRGRGVLACLCAQDGVSVEEAAGLLLAQCLPFFRSRGLSQVSVLVSSENARLASFLFGCGFRIMSVMVRMYHGERPQEPPLCSPLASEKG